METKKMNDIPMNCILIHTDGACSGNPGPGGWAAMIQRIVDEDVQKELTISGYATATTNNVMELTAALTALGEIKYDESLPIIIRSDSQYVVKGINAWLAGWIERGGRTAKKKPVENWPLWQKMNDAISKRPSVRAVWVKGHSGDPANEEVDRLAQLACAEARAELAETE